MSSFGPVDKLLEMATVEAKSPKSQLFFYLQVCLCAICVLLPSGGKEGIQSPEIVVTVM